jgi:hypothetical protein
MSDAGLLLLLWVVVFGLLGVAVADHRGQSRVAGFFLGGILGIIGVLLVAISKPSAQTVKQQSRCPFCAEQVQDAAVVCKSCGRDLPMRACIHCSRQMQRGGVKCPNCGEANPVWKLHEGRWWTRDKDGKQWVLDETSNQWVQA